MKGTSKFRMPGIICLSIATITILSLFFPNRMQQKETDI